jgi:hypothetical protein
MAADANVELLSSETVDWIAWAKGNGLLAD